MLELLTDRDIAALLRVSRRTVSRLIPRRRARPIGRYSSGPSPAGLPCR